MRLYRLESVRDRECLASGKEVWPIQWNHSKPDTIGTE